MLHAARLITREAANVRFVDDRLADTTAEMPVAFPIEIIVDDDAFGWTDNSIGRRQIIAGQSLGVRINQPGASVEPLAPLRIPRAFRLQVVKLSDADAGNKNAP